MPTFTSFVQLQAGLEKYLKAALDQVGEKVWEELYKFIEQEVYLNNRLKLYPDGGYERTYNFLNSVKRSSVRKIVKGYQVEIYIDTDSINEEYRSDAFFNAHMSLDGTPVSEWMPYFIDKGQNSRVYSYDGIGFMSFIENYVNVNYDRLLKLELSRLGI